ncbi:hypothetical protein Bca101_065949 [Brassica carinata]
MDFENNSTMDIIGVMIGVAFGLHVRELKLRVNSSHMYRFPTSLFNCGTLETLKLDGDVLLDVPFPVCLKALRTLRLYGVSYKDDESVVNLLSGCSSLENLQVVLYPFSYSDVKTFNIDVPSLQSLTLTSDHEDFESFTAYVINAPSLKHLQIYGLMQDESSCLIENMPALVEAHINVCGVIYENIHGFLTSLKRLSLNIESPLDLTKFPTGRIFNQLLYFKILAFKPEWWNLFTLMLDSSPNLQVLKLINKYSRERDQLLACKRWSPPNYVQECLVNRLETLVWNNYEGEIEDEKELAQYILRNACRLKTATFSRTDIHPVKNLDMYKKLASVVRASNSCQLVFKETDVSGKYDKLITFLGL